MNTLEYVEKLIEIKNSTFEIKGDHKPTFGVGFAEEVLEHELVSNIAWEKKAKEVGDVIAYFTLMHYYCGFKPFFIAGCIDSCFNRAEWEIAFNQEWQGDGLNVLLLNYLGAIKRAFRGESSNYYTPMIELLTYVFCESDIDESRFTFVKETNIQKLLSRKERNYLNKEKGDNR